MKGCVTPMTSVNKVDYFYAGVSRRFGTPFADYVRVFESVNDDFCTSSIIHDAGWQILVNALNPDYEDILDNVIKKHFRGHSHKKLANFLRNNKLHTNFFVLGKSDANFVVFLDYDPDTLFCLDAVTVNNILGKAVNADELCDMSAPDNDEYVGILKASNYCKKGNPRDAKALMAAFDRLVSDRQNYEVTRSRWASAKLKKVTEALNNNQPFSQDEFDECLDFIDENCTDMHRYLYTKFSEANSINTTMMDAIYGRVMPYEERISIYKRLFIYFLESYHNCTGDKVLKPATAAVLTVNNETMTISNSSNSVSYVKAFENYLDSAYRDGVREVIERWCEECRTPHDFKGKPIDLPEDRYEISLLDVNKNTMNELSEFFSAKTDTVIVLRLINRYMILNSVNYYMKKYHDWTSALAAVTEMIGDILFENYDVFSYNVLTPSCAYEDIDSTRDDYTFCAIAFHHAYKQFGGNADELLAHIDDIFTELICRQKYCLNLMALVNQIDICLENHEPIHMSVFNDTFTLDYDFGDIDKMTNLPDVYKILEDETLEKNSPDSMRNLICNFLARLDDRRAGYTCNYEMIDLSSQHIKSYDTNVIDLGLFYRTGFAYLMNVVQEDVPIRDFLCTSRMTDSEKMVLLQILLRGLIYCSLAIYANVSYSSVFVCYPDFIPMDIRVNGTPMEKLL
jgi:hypothetical protein